MYKILLALGAIIGIGFGAFKMLKNKNNQSNDHPGDITITAQ